MKPVCIRVNTLEKFIKHLEYSGVFVHKYKLSHHKLRDFKNTLKPYLKMEKQRDGWYIPKQKITVTVGEII